jgi:hypothetical protein
MPPAERGASALSLMWPTAFAATGAGPQGISSSGTRSEKAAQGGILPILCGTTNVPYKRSPPFSHPVGRSPRNVPFLTGQKGDGKSRRAGRATADGPALRRGRERPGKRLGGRRRGKQVGGTALFPFCICSSWERAAIRRRSQPDTEITSGVMWGHGPTVPRTRDR